MSRSLTASDRKNLIRLASTMPKGSQERRAILAGLKKASSYFGDVYAVIGEDPDLADRILRGLERNFSYTDDRRERDKLEREAEKIRREIEIERRLRRSRSSKP